MPNRWPITSGNWSNAAIWSGSLIPTASDDVFSNGQTVNIDTDISIRSLQNADTGSVVAGGFYTISSSIAITASIGIQTGNAIASIISNGMIQIDTTGSVIISGSITRPLNSGAFVLNNTNNGTLTIIGNVRGPGQLLVSSTPAVRNSLNGTIRVLGNLIGGGTSGNHAIQNNANGSIIVTGNVFGSDGAGAGTTGILNLFAGNVIVTGNVFGGHLVSNHYGIQNSNVGTVTVTGNVFASGSTPGIFSSTAGIINVIGTLQASTFSNAVTSTSTNAVNIFSGPFNNSGSRNALYCYNVQLYDDITTSYTIAISGSTNSITLLSPDQIIGVPSGSDVRFGLNYGPGNELTGSMHVPHPNSVSYGIAVDNTTGTAIAKPEDVWSIAVTSLTASNSIGQRLANTITTASMQDIVNAFS